MQEDMDEVRVVDVEQSAENRSLAALDPSGRLYNKDLAPTGPDEREWSTYSLFALWMNDAHNLGDYAFAAALFAIGLSAWEVTVGLLGGILIIFGGCVLSGFMGRDTGVPFSCPPSCSTSPTSRASPPVGAPSSAATSGASR